MSSQDIEGAAGAKIGQAETAADAAVEGVGQRVKDEARHFAARTETLAADARHAIDRAAGQARAAAASAADVYANARGRARAVSDAVDPFVRESPYQAVLLGVVAGLILGVLLFARPPRTIYVRPPRD